MNVIQAMNAVRWRIEQVNRDVKQLLGTKPPPSKDGGLDKGLKSTE